MIDPSTAPDLVAAAEFGRSWRCARRDQAALRAIAPNGVTVANGEIQRVAIMLAGMGAEWIIWVLRRAGLPAVAGQPFTMTHTRVTWVRRILNAERHTPAGGILAHLASYNIMGRYGDSRTLLTGMAGTMPTDVLDDYTNRCRRAYRRNRGRH